MLFFIFYFLKSSGCSVVLCWLCSAICSVRYCNCKPVAIVVQLRERVCAVSGAIVGHPWQCMLSVVSEGVQLEVGGWGKTLEWVFSGSDC